MHVGHKSGVDFAMSLISVNVDADENNISAVNFNKWNNEKNQEEWEFHLNKKKKFQASHDHIPSKLERKFQSLWLNTSNLVNCSFRLYKYSRNAHFTKKKKFERLLSHPVHVSKTESKINWIVINNKFTRIFTVYFFYIRIWKGQKVDHPVAYNVMKTKTRHFQK